MSVERSKKIHVCKDHWKRLMELVSAELVGRSGPSVQYLKTLQEELRQARVLAADKMPIDVVALGTRVMISDLDLGQTLTVMPVMPSDAGRGERLSVLSPLGMALLGYQSGDRIDWGPLDHLIRFQIQRVIHQNRYT